MEEIFNYQHPFICTDAVIFTIKSRGSDSYRKLPSNSIGVLLYRRDRPPYSGKWCIPGGFLEIDEEPEHNIRRKILEKANLEQCYLEQLYTFCEVDRDPRARVISIAYLGLIDEEISQQFDEGEWFKLNIQENGELSFQNRDYKLEREDFGFDHYQIIKLAFARLQSKVCYSDIIFNLLPKEFTLTHFQNIYEIILNKKEQTANFRRKVMTLVEEKAERTKDKGHRPAKLYSKKA